MDDEHYFANFNEDPPEDFGESLYNQLNALEQLNIKREDKISMTSYAKPFPIQAVSATPASKRPRGRGALLAFIATIATTLLIGMFIFNATRPNSVNLFQPAPIDLNALQPITADNLDDLTLLATLGDGNIFDVAWSPDSTTVAVAGTGGIHLHDANDLNAPSRLLTNQDMVITSIDYSSNGTIIAGTHMDTIWLWAVATGEVLQTIQTQDLLIHPNDLSNVEFSPDDTRLSVLGCIEEVIDEDTQAEVCRRSAIEMYSLDNGELLQTINLGTGLITDIKFAPDWSILGYSFYNSSTITLIDVATGEQFTLIESELEGTAASFAFTLDSQQILIMNSNNSRTRELLTIADLPTITDSLNLELQSPNYSNAVQLAMHPNNEWYIVGGAISSAYTIVFRNIEDGQVAPSSSIINRYNLSKILFSPDGNYILGQSFDGVLTVFDISDENTIENTHYGYNWISNTAVFSQDDTQLFTTSYRGPATEWDLTTTPATRTFWGNDPDLNEINSIREIQLHPTENHLYYVNDIPSTGSQFFYRDLDTDEITPTSIAFSYYNYPSWTITTNNELINVNTINGRIQRWSQETMTTETIPLRDIQGTSRTNGFNSGNISPDATYFFIGICRGVNMVTDCNEPWIIIGDTTTGLPLARIELTYNTNTNLSFSSTSQSLLIQWCTEPTRTTDNGSVYIGCDNYSHDIWDLTILDELNIALEEVDTEESEIAFDSIPLLPSLNVENLDCNGWSMPEFIQIEGEDFIAHPCGTEAQILSFDRTTGETQVLRSFSGLYSGFTLNHSGTILAVQHNNTIELWGIPE